MMARIQQRIDEELQKPELIKPIDKSARKLKPAEWFAAVRAWADSHPPTTGRVDDSRESIYEGRGL